MEWAHHHPPGSASALPAFKTVIQGIGYSRTLGRKRAVDGAVLIELPFDEHIMTLRWPAINPKGYARFIHELLQ